MPVLPPESIAAQMAVISLTPASIKALITIGAPVPPPIVTTFINLYYILFCKWEVQDLAPKNLRQYSSALMGSNQAQEKMLR